tara:strand:+ start:2655 stop:3329 length:675 start_codon:yes stop_codon:yes gene_type:complete
VEVWHEVDGLLQGYPEADANGEPSPFSNLHDFPLRRMFETFFARYSLFGGEVLVSMNLSMQELSLLANMTVPAVRTSLSKEGFKLGRVHEKIAGRPDDKAFRLKAGDALLWLSRRRGFIPQRSLPEGIAVQEKILHLLSNETMPFHMRLGQAVTLVKQDTAAFAAASGIDANWLSALLAGKAVSPAIESLRALADALDVPAPAFVGAGVRHHLSIETTGASEKP